MSAQAAGSEWEASTFLARCADRGYGVLPLSDAARALVEESFATATNFFQMPSAAKSASELPQGCGYRPYGREYSGSKRRFDRIESFTASRRTETTALALENPPARDLHRVMAKTIRALEPDCETLIAGIAQVLDPSTEVRALGAGLKRWSCLQINCAPATSPRSLIHPPHEDGHLLTLGVADGRGLEVRMSTGDFTAVSIPDDAAIGMPGETARLMTGGRLQPLYHRVRGTGRVRMAVLFFIDLAPADCTPWVRNAVNEGVDIGAAVLRNPSRFGVGGFALE